MSETNDNPTLGLVKRWVEVFNSIVKMLRCKPRITNAEMVESVMADEPEASTPEEKAQQEEKKQVYMEICESVDAFYRKMEEADKAEDLDEWFDDQVRDFATYVIPDADEKDVKEVEEMVDQMIDDDIKIHQEGLIDEYEDEGETQKM